MKCPLLHRDYSKVPPKINENFNEYFYLRVRLEEIKLSSVSYDTPFIVFGFEKNLS